MAAELPPSDRRPRHVAIIMDGNGRWASQRGLTRHEGHRAGVRALREVVSACAAWGIPYLTLYAFSTENWSRPAGEVAGLMNLVLEVAATYGEELRTGGVRVHVLGDVDRLPRRARAALLAVVRSTAGNGRLHLNLAVNYGARHELVRAARRLAAEVGAGQRAVEDIDEAAVADQLYTAGQPDPDLVIRPAGELRLSNFLLWQSAYAELWFTPTYWPDFGREELLAALRDYASRQRRFGALGDGDTPGSQ